MNSTSDIKYFDYKKYSIFNTNVFLFVSETEHGFQTVAEIDNIFHYLGDEYYSLETAIALWQTINKRALSREEMKQVAKDNGIF